MKESYIAEIWRTVLCLYVWQGYIPAVPSSQGNEMLELEAQVCSLVSHRSMYILGFIDGSLQVFVKINYKLHRQLILSSQFDSLLGLWQRKFPCMVHAKGDCLVLVDFNKEKLRGLHTDREGAQLGLYRYEHRTAARAMAFRFSPPRYH